MLNRGPEAPNIDFRFIRPPAREVTYTAHVLHADPSLIVLEQTVSPSNPLSIDGEEVLAEGYRALWFLFQGASYDVARFYRPGGDLTGYYVDILEPVHWSDSDPRTLEPIVDLFLDLWVTPDGRYRVLDEDEFDEAVRAGALTTDQATHARHTLDECIAGIAEELFPPLPARNFT